MARIKGLKSLNQFEQCKSCKILVERNLWKRQNMQCSGCSNEIELTPRIQINSKAHTDTIRLLEIEKEKNSLLEEKINILNTKNLILSEKAEEVAVKITKHKTKICNRCNKELPLSEFWEQKKYRDGVRKFCKNCGRAYNKENRNNNGGSVKCFECKSFRYRTFFDKHLFRKSIKTKNVSIFRKEHKYCIDCELKKGMISEEYYNKFIEDRVNSSKKTWFQKILNFLKIIR
jgi:uncharacterized protein YlzI (FlbEa/FlbD family)